MNNKSLSNWLIASDIDGTLNNKFRRLPKRNELAINEFVSAGGHFTLASGRNPQSMEKHFRRLPIAGTPAVVINGAGLYDFEKNEMIFFSAMSEEGMQLAIEAAKRFPTVDVIVVAKDMIYVTGIGYFGRFFVAADKLKHRCIKNIEDVPKKDWGKVIISGLPIDISKVKKHFTSMDDPDLTLMSSSIASFEILARNTNKGTALLKLADMLGIDKSHVGAIGDYFNDFDMLKCVGVPACCGQAPRELKEISEFVACHCNKGAVADFLEYIEAKQD
ncbi:MAG: Cof-type HAD-IIB family hydrolase [Oscillospiraceae bacterium]|nr:Cof-type HAD-IIB family hydrolase [Oscillospiraceae bacterium]